VFSSKQTVTEFLETIIKNMFYEITISHVFSVVFIIYVAFINSILLVLAFEIKADKYIPETHSSCCYLQLIHSDDVTQVAMKVQHRCGLIQVPSSDMPIRDLKLTILHHIMEIE
jgi:hypothetical protein